MIKMADVDDIRFDFIQNTVKTLIDIIIPVSVFIPGIIDYMESDPGNFRITFPPQLKVRSK